MKMPAASRIASADASVARDKEALAALRAKGEPFTVPGFTRELAAILAREAGIQRKLQ